MELHHYKIIETSIVLGAYLILRVVSAKLIKKTMADKLILRARGELIGRAIKLILVAICFSVILIIWGVKQSELAVFIGSVLTVIGVAMFAQWSILSNITSSMIIFFNHPVKIGDEISILEGKEYEVVGRVINIGLFFFTIATKENEELTLPNNVFIQKMIKKTNEGQQQRNLEGKANAIAPKH
jgi:small-conductance mechanosensitive channel